MSHLAKSGPVVGYPRPQKSEPSLPSLQSAEVMDAFLQEVPPSPNPLPPPPLLSPLPSSADTSRVASTAPTQLLRRGTFSNSPSLSDKDVCSRFLLYNAAGGLVGAREPTDPWGVLVSEYITLNCTYNHRTVRVGRDDGCDAVLKNALVSTTHFTISLELEPYEPHDSVRSSPTESIGDVEGMGWEGKPSGIVETRTDTTTRSWALEKGGESSREEKEPLLSSSSTAVPLSPQDVGLPRWRVRRVLLTDCSANGTYVNDELVGRGRYRELHSGNDINIVRVPEAASPGGASPSSPTQSCATKRSSSDSDCVNEEAKAQQPQHTTAQMSSRQERDEPSGREKSLIRQSRRALRELKRKHPTASDTATPTTAGAATWTKQRRQRPRENDNDREDEDEDDGDASRRKEDLEKTQMFTALLSSLSTKYTYLERFCFHLYSTEEQPPQQQQQPQSHGMAQTPQQIFAVVDAEEVKEKAREKEKWESQNEMRGSALPKLLSITSLQHNTDRAASAAKVATVPHQRLVRFVDPLETEVGTEQEEEEEDNHEQRVTSTTTAAAVTFPPSKESGSLAASAGLPGKLTARQEQVVSTLVTPYSLLRSRPSIRTSFIAPITLSEREGSTVSSANSPPHHAVSEPSSSTAAERFRESLGISPALQRKTAAQQRADVRQVNDNQLLASRRSHNNNRANVSGALGGMLKDMPADIPIRYAVLPLRHLQWGGRIGSGASGEVYMGIDVSTATAVAIKVLKGGSLFPLTKEEEGKALPSTTTAEGQRGTNLDEDGGVGGIASAGQSPALRHYDDTLLTLSDVSFGNTPPTSPSMSEESVSMFTAPTTSVSLSKSSATAVGSPFGGAGGKGGDDEEALPEARFKENKATALTSSLAAHVEQVEVKAAYANEESAVPNAVTTPLTPVASAVVPDNTPIEFGRRPSTALALTHTQQPGQQQPPRPPQQQQQRGGGGPRVGRSSAPPIIRKHFREIVFLTTLQHHRIVRFLGFQFNADGRLCLLMEYVAGGTLQTLIRNFGVFEENVIRLYTLQILEGLEYLARKGVVHGDLKSANILVSEQGSVKLTDFGTSRFVRECASDEVASEVAERRSRISTMRDSTVSHQQQQQHRQRHSSPSHSADGSFLHSVEKGIDVSSPNHTTPQQLNDEEANGAFSREHSGGESEEVNENDDVEEVDALQHRVLCGTPLYMSPELIRTQEPSFASDIWALGCVVYEMATGGVLPWRPVHHTNASAVIWYIGQRHAASEGPPLDDVYTERERLNQAAMSRSKGATEYFGMEEGDHHHNNGEGNEERTSQQHNGGSGWSMTPSPMLIDLLQCTLNMSAADRPSAAELLQHPFIRGESSLAALEKWHATVAAKRRALKAKSPPKQIEGAFESYAADEGSENNASGAMGGSEGEEREREDRTRPRRSRTSASRNSTRSSTGSPFESAAFITGTNNNSSNNVKDVVEAVASPQSTMSWRIPTQTPSFLASPQPQQPQPRVEEVIIDADADGGVNQFPVSHALTYENMQGKGRTSRPASTASSPPPPSLAALPQPASSILVKSCAASHPAGRSSSNDNAHENTAPTLPLMSDSWEDVKPLFTSLDALVSQPPQMAEATAYHAEHKESQLSPVLIAQPHPPRRFNQSRKTRNHNNANAETSSVLGEGNPDSQPLINEPPHPIDATGQHAGFWGKMDRREHTQTNSTASPLSQMLPHAPYSSSGSSHLQPTAQLFCRTAPQFKVPHPRSQTHVSFCVNQQQQQQRRVESTSLSNSGFPRSMIAEHQMFLREKEQERRSSSLAPLQVPRQVRGRPRLEASLPTYTAATHQPQASVLGNSRGGCGYNYQNPQLNTQTIELQMPLRFASQPNLNASRRYGWQQQHGKSHADKRKARMGGAQTSQSQMLQNAPQQQQQQPFNAQRQRPWNTEPNSQDYGGVVDVASNSGAPLAVGEESNLTLNDVPAARSPRRLGSSRSRPVLGDVTDNSTTNSNAVAQQANYSPSQLRSTWKHGELALEMGNMTFGLSRAGIKPESATAFMGTVPQSSPFALHGSSNSNSNNLDSGMMMPSKPSSPQQQHMQQQMHGPASSAYNRGCNITSSSPASPPDYAKDTTPVLGEGSRPQRRFLLRRSHGRRRSGREQRQNAASTRLREEKTEGSIPRRSSIGSLRQRRRGHSRQANRHDLPTQQMGGGETGNNNSKNSSSGFPPQTNSENKSVALLSPSPASASAQPPPQSSAEQQKTTQNEAASEASAASTPETQKKGSKTGKRRGATPLPSSTQSKNAAKHEPRARLKRGK